MFWCYNCQQLIQSIQQSRCEICSCEAIEQVSSESGLPNFEPYVSNSNGQSNNANQNQTSQQSQHLLSNLMRNALGMGMVPSMSPMPRMVSTIYSQIGDQSNLIFIRYTVTRPIFGILLLNSEDEEKISVSQQKIDSLQKVEIKEQCAICQEKEGQGIKLPCKHEFHDNCIKPWFQQANTCPCCRNAV